MLEKKPLVDVRCYQCGRHFQKPQWQVNKNGRDFCNQECRKKMVQLKKAAVKPKKYFCSNCGLLMRKGEGRPVDNQYMLLGRVCAICYPIMRG